MDSHGIETHQLMLTASTCLFISGIHGKPNKWLAMCHLFLIHHFSPAKYVDIDGNFPRISHLQSLNNFQNSTYEYKVMEILLLNFWKWNLNCATSLHFLEHIMASNLSPFCGSSFRRQAVDLVNLTLLEFQFISYKPSVIAASCIAVTRIQFQLFPVWPVMLETLTSYSLTDLCLCIQNINQIVLNGSLNPFSKVQLNSHPSLRQKMDRNKRDKSEKSEKSLKAPVMSHNGATIKRQNSLQPRDLKNLYYANI